MIVSIWRHGQAGSAVSDRQRTLTGTGEDDVGFGCQQFHEACRLRGIDHPGTILHSPWVRTTQTADILATAFTHATLASSEALQPGSDVHDVDRMLQPLFAADETPSHLALVSHQPLVSRLVDHLLGEVGVVPPLTPGGLACLELEAPARGCGRLLFWALPPEYEAGV